MNKLYELLLMRKKEFDYSILFASILILCSSILLRHKKSNFLEALIEILSPLLLGFCVLGIWAWYRATRYAYYTKKIRKRYVQTLYKQEYKLRRLTSIELHVLNGLLSRTPVKQIAIEHKLPVSEIYRCIDVLITKLDIQQKNIFIDIDWKNAIGQ